MNKLTLSCLKSLVEVRFKGDWDFLTQLVVVWPEARVHYWNNQGFKPLLGSWPFSRKKYGLKVSFLLLPEGEVLHGFQTDVKYRSCVRIFEHGELLLSIIYETREMAQSNNPTWEIWSVGQGKKNYPTYPVLLSMNKDSFQEQMKESPIIKRKVLRALNLVRDLGKTKIRALNDLAALTYKA